MRPCLFVLIVLTFTASLAFGQAGRIGLYADTNGMDCNLVDVQGLLSVYAVHVGTSDARVIWFQAAAPACFTGNYLADNSQFLTIGNSQAGVAVDYQSCLSSPIHVLTINYFGSGTTPACCVFPIDPHPDAPSGQIEGRDCNDEITFPTGGVAVMTPDGSCPCELLPTENSTWGKVKALYYTE